MRDLAGRRRDVENCLALGLDAQLAERPLKPWRARTCLAAAAAARVLMIDVLRAGTHVDRVDR